MYRQTPERRLKAAPRARALRETVPAGRLDAPVRGLIPSRRQQVQEVINSPLEGLASRGESQTKRPSGLCEGRFGGGVKRVFLPFRIIPPTARLRASPSSCRLPLKGGVDSGFSSVEGVTPPTPPCQGGIKVPRCRKSHRHSGESRNPFYDFFTFVFAFDSDSREGTPRLNPERMRRIYMAASVSSPVGREDIGAKGQRQRRKWIPAFAGMTNKSEGQSQAKRGLFQQTLKGGVI